MNFKMNEALTRKVLEIIRNKAEKLAADAALSGQWGDGGGGELLRGVEFFESVSRGEYPSVWKEYVKQAANELDPEYEKYLELKKKFERR